MGFLSDEDRVRLRAAETALPRTPLPMQIVETRGAAIGLRRKSPPIAGKADCRATGATAT